MVTFSLHSQTYKLEKGYFIFVGGRLGIFSLREFILALDEFLLQVCKTILCFSEILLACTQPTHTKIKWYLS